MKIDDINSSLVVSYPAKADVDNNTIFDGKYQISLQYDSNRHSISTK